MVIKETYNGIRIGDVVKWYSSTGVKHGTVKEVGSFIIFVEEYMWQENAK